jgi:hypothetical protein
VQFFESTLWELICQGLRMLAWVFVGCLTLWAGVRIAFAAYFKTRNQYRREGDR